MAGLQTDRDRRDVLECYFIREVEKRQLLLYWGASLDSEGVEGHFHPALGPSFAGMSSDG